MRRRPEVNVLLTRFWPLLAVLGTALGAVGAQYVYAGVTNSEAAHTTCAEFAKSLSAQRWVQLSECRYDVDSYAFEGSKASPSRLFIPVIDRHDDEGQVAVVLVTSEPRWLAFARARAAMAAAPSPEEFAALEAQHAFAFTRDTLVTGMVQSGVLLDSKARADVADQVPELTENFVLLDDGAQPRLGLGVLLLTLGLLALAGAVVGAVRRRQT